MYDIPFVHIAHKPHEVFPLHVVHTFMLFFQMDSENLSLNMDLLDSPAPFDEEGFYLFFYFFFSHETVFLIKGEWSHDTVPNAASDEFDNLFQKDNSDNRLHLSICEQKNILGSESLSKCIFEVIRPSSGAEPATFHAKFSLFQSQIEACNKLHDMISTKMQTKLSCEFIRDNFCALVAETGSGKTVMMFFLFSLLLKTFPNLYLVILCPMVNFISFFIPKLNIQNKRV